MAHTDNKLCATKPFPSHPYPYHPLLTESVARFLTEYRKGVTEFNDFATIFSRILHAERDPPLQLVWFYAALEFHTLRIRTDTEPSRTTTATRTASYCCSSFSVAKDLFQLLVSCCDGCGGSVKRIGALAPLVFRLHRLAIREKGLKSEVEGLVDALIGYCSIVCGNVFRADNGDGDDDGAVVLESDFVDLIRVWMVDDEEFGGDCVKGFFPLVSDGFWKGMKAGSEIGTIGFLAGVVMCEALLLKLCLQFEAGVPRAELEKKLQGCAVQTIAGFRNFYFLDTLFRMMLEPVLPVISLLGSENEALLKDVLYNSVMTIEYSFINPQAGVSLPDKNLKDVAITWLFVADLAIQSAREKGDHGKAMSYVNSFSGSCIPIQLINWVTSKCGVGRKISRPNVSTPIALIKWLLDVQDQGLAFGGANHRAKANFFTSRTECMLPVIKHFFNNLDKNLFSNSIHGGTTEADKPDDDIDMVDSVDTVSLAADDIMSATATDVTRKRKEGFEDETRMQLKFMRCQFQENSVRESSFIFRQQ